MSFFKGISSIVASPFTLVKETAESITNIGDEFESGDFMDGLKATTKVATLGLSGVFEGAVKTCKKISDDFDD